MDTYMNRKEDVTRRRPAIRRTTQWRRARCNDHISSNHIHNNTQSRIHAKTRVATITDISEIAQRLLERILRCTDQQCKRGGYGQSNPVLQWASIGRMHEKHHGCGALNNRAEAEPAKLNKLGLGGVREWGGGASPEPHN